MKKISDKFKILEDNLGSPEAEAGIKVTSIRLDGQEILFKHLDQKHFDALCRHITQAYCDCAFSDVYHGERALAVVWKTLGHSLEGFRGICLACLNGAQEITGDEFLVTKYKHYLQKRDSRTIVLPAVRQPRLN